MKLILKGGRVINPAEHFDEVADVLIEDGKIAAIGKDLAAEGAEVYDAAGKLVTPGLIDMHTHFREPGQEAKEDFESGSKAAAAGGYTTVATMPNTKPVVDAADIVRSLQKRAEDVAKVHIRIIGAVTKGQKGQELAELGDMVEAGAVAFSDDGHFDPTAKVLLNAYDYLHTFDKVIINHEEETSLVEDGVMNEGHRSAMLGMKGRPTVAELVQDAGVRLFPVGRLDCMSEGLLLFTDDGEMANRLAHPSHGVSKTYRVWVSGPDAAEAAGALRRPIVYEGVRYRAAEVRVLRSTEDRALIDVTIREGKNREVRNMCAAAGLKVQRLLRIRQGEISLGDLPAGQWRYLTAKELEYLQSLR